MWLWLDKGVYHRLHDIILPCSDGTTQIDHVLVSVYGIFVIETKNMKGWIFGDERSPQWTQTIFGKKSRFQNPLRQNYRHVVALSEYLDFPQEKIHSVVFFIGDCEFKTPMPQNVLNNGLCQYIKGFQDVVFTQEEVDEIRVRLQRTKAAKLVSHKEHVEGLKERHGGDNCPKCGSSLVLRTARKGTNSYGQFYGCSNYPKCRYTRTA